jgi:hypothetical protein
MSSGLKAFSQSFINFCRRHPKAALLIVPLFVCMAYNGFSTAALVQGTQGREPLKMKIERVYDENSGSIGPKKYRADGYVLATRAPVVVPIYRAEFLRLKPGHTLNVVATGQQERPYVKIEYSEKQLQKVYFSIGAFHFNDLALFGCIAALGFMGWAFFAKPSSDGPESTPMQSTNANKPDEATANSRS